jgi:hypothetical protein
LSPSRMPFVTFLENQFRMSPPLFTVLAKISEVSPVGMAAALQVFLTLVAQKTASHRSSIYTR